VHIKQSYATQVLGFHCKVLAPTARAIEDLTCYMNVLRMAGRPVATTKAAVAAMVVDSLSLSLERNCHRRPCPDADVEPDAEKKPFSPNAAVTAVPDPGVSGAIPDTPVPVCPFCGLWPCLTRRRLCAGSGCGCA
jgi:hypothetical protein